ncbi:SpoIIAA-like [Yoonia tamlensis]|uniref:SpoIIAA-like n=1 Tax=Yoonia tamlensis TaxID=390270 RepID=A0A1I6H9K2_9RHOB|nr:STAS/SEC14 domain-containing protein [Yoonia tamlensis]SFR51216.1 SpoIIAA-like [Yoonia tamlensis]
MIKITKQSPTRVDVAIDGAIDADMMRAGLDDLFAKVEGVTNGRMLYTITNIAMPSLGAIGVEMEKLPKLFGLLGKVSKCAVLADAAWVRKVAAFEGMLLPGMTIKSFEMSERDAAESWLAS